jgi:hypothetical protein
MDDNDHEFIIDFTVKELSVLTERAESLNMTIEAYLTYLIEKAVEDDQRECKERQDSQGTADTQ